MRDKKEPWNSRRNEGMVLYDEEQSTKKPKRDQISLTTQTLN